MAGICHSISLKPEINSMKLWIVDFGASQHICSNANVFAFMRLVRNVTISLPNGTCISVSLSGDVELNSKLLFKEVLVVPQFSLNLLSVSAVITNSQLTITFFYDHFLI